LKFKFGEADIKSKENSLDTKNCSIIKSLLDEKLVGIWETCRASRQAENIRKSNLVASFYTFEIALDAEFFKHFIKNRNSEQFQPKLN
jgi:hypothetical protein